MAVAYRPSHADATYDAKYGVRAIAGGGRSSARETIGRVAAGAIARKILKMYNNIEVLAYVSRVQEISCEGIVNDDTFTMEQVDANMVRCPDADIAAQMLARIDAIRKDGNSIGGVVTCVARNVPAGLGAPVFDKLEADLAKAMLSIPACKGFESGDGFAGTLLTGKEHNDEFYIDPVTGATRTSTNRSGGIQGGISNGENIVIHVAFKPTSTIGKVQVRSSYESLIIFQERLWLRDILSSHHVSFCYSIYMYLQKTVTRGGQAVELRGKGRHDPCVLPRAVPMVEAMMALTLVDHLMMQKAQCELFPIDTATATSVQVLPNPMGKTAVRPGGPAAAAHAEPDLVAATMTQKNTGPVSQRVDEE
jgi:chorismate synthase